MCGCVQNTAADAAKRNHSRSLSLNGEAMFLRYYPPKGEGWTKQKPCLDREPGQGKALDSF